MRRLNERTRFALTFAAACIGGFILLGLPQVQSYVITPMTEQLARVSAAILRLLGQDVTIAGTSIMSSRFAVEILNGCNGAEAILLLVACIASFPARAKEKVLGIVAGSVLLQLVNIGRIVSLYLLGAYRRDLFDLFHSAVWQVMIILVSLVIFSIWSHRVRASTPLAAAG